MKRKSDEEAMTIAQGIEIHGFAIFLLKQEMPLVDPHFVDAFWDDREGIDELNGKRRRIQCLSRETALQIIRRNQPL